MKQSAIVFHVAIPCADLDTAHEFYVEKLGCKLGRRYDDRISLNFFGAQIVCHLAPGGTDPEPKIYPRHFGISLRDREDFENLLRHAKEKGLKFFGDSLVRFEGQSEEHVSFFLCDPSNNLLEFKHYRDPEMTF